jgi:hypothetical protein
MLEILWLPRRYCNILEVKTVCIELILPLENGNIELSKILAVMPPPIIPTRIFAKTAKPFFCVIVSLLLLDRYRVRVDR